MYADDSDCIRNFTAQNPIGKHLIVTWGTDDLTVDLANSATDKLMGISSYGCTTSGDRIDVVMCDFAMVTLGGTVTRGDPLTANASGQAIKATVSGSRLIGYANRSGIVNQQIEIMIELGYLP